MAVERYRTNTARRLSFDCQSCGTEIAVEWDDGPDARRGELFLMCPRCPRVLIFEDAPVSTSIIQSQRQIDLSTLPSVIRLLQRIARGDAKPSVASSVAAFLAGGLVTP